MARWIGVHFFRFWTAVSVVAGYGYLWFNKPEYLTWWKRGISDLVEAACAELPYPWGDRVETTIGNFGIWVQLTLAILALRIVVGCILMLGRATFRRRRQRP